MTVEEVMDWLRRDDGRIEDIFGLWVQGKRDDRWVAEKLMAEGHAAALAAPSRDAGLDDFIAQAQHFRAEHDATHGEAEMCGAECIVLGLTEFTDDQEQDDLDAMAPGNFV